MPDSETRKVKGKKVEKTTSKFEAAVKQLETEPEWTFV